VNLSGSSAFSISLEKGEDDTRSRASRPHAVLLDKQFFWKHVPLFGDPSHRDGEVDETVNALLTSKVV
jgi:hypothetical protein